MISHTQLTTTATPDEPRLYERPAWIVTSICLVASLITLLFMILPASLASGGTGDPAIESILAGTVGFVGAIIGFFLIARLFGIPPAALFLRLPTTATLAWAGVGIALGGMVVILATAAGWATLSPGQLTSTELILRLVAGLAIGLWTGTLEEFLMRGVILSILGHRWHWPGAVVVSAVIFGLLHHAAGDTVTAALLYVGITTVAGLLFGIVTVSTGTVWNAVFMHAAWNALFNEFVVGVEASSVEPVLSVTVGPHFPVAAGQAALPESPLSLCLFVLTLLGTWWWIHRDVAPSTQSIP